MIVFKTDMFRRVYVREDNFLNVCDCLSPETAEDVNVISGHSYSHQRYYPTGLYMAMLGTYLHCTLVDTTY